MKILVYDHGLCLEAAISLAHAGHTVGYHVTPVDKHSLHNVAQMGSGFESEGVNKVDDFWSAIDKVDLICCFDTYSGDLVDYLRKHNYKVFGAGSNAERLELDRWFAKNAMRSLPTTKVERIQGVVSLIEKLEHAKPCWVKCSGFREIETFRHDNWTVTQEQFIAPLLIEYGTDPDLVFILEDDIDPAIEVGCDSLIVNGEWPVQVTPYGYEAKDSAYIGFFGATTLPNAMKRVNDVITPHLLAASTFVSSEVRVTPNGDGYPVDLTIRAPHPPMAAMLEALDGITTVFTSPKNGKGIWYLKPRVNYAAVLVGTSGWSEEHRCEIKFPTKIRQWVKLMKAYKQNNKYFTLPSSSFTVLAVGIGATVDQAIKGCKGVAEQIKGRELTFDYSALDKIKDETIPKGKKCGIPF